MANTDQVVETFVEALITDSSGLGGGLVINQIQQVNESYVEVIVLLKETGTAAGPLGALVGSATGLRTTFGTLSGPLGILSGSATGSKVIHGTSSGPLGSLSGSGIGKRTTFGTLPGALGRLNGSGVGVRTTFGAGAAPLGVLLALGPIFVSSSPFVIVYDVRQYMFPAKLFNVLYSVRQYVSSTFTIEYGVRVQVVSADFTISYSVRSRVVTDPFTIVYDTAAASPTTVLSDSFVIIYHTLVRSQYDQLDTTTLNPDPVPPQIVTTPLSGAW